MSIDPHMIGTADLLKEKKRRVVRDLVLRDFGLFCRQIMRDPNNPEHVPLAPFHMNYCRWLQRCGKRKGFKALTLFPRFHLKTELGDKDYALWRYLHDNNLRVFIFNAVEDVAQKFLLSIKQEVLQNERLRYVFPEIAVPERGIGNQEEIWLPRAARLRDGTFTALGMGSSTAGRRYDLGIYDDIIPEPTPQQPHTPEFLHGITEWFFQTLFLRDSLTRSDVSVIGTRWHDADTYGQLEQDPSYKTFMRVVETNGRPIWKAKFPIEAILEEREKYAHAGKLTLFLAQMYQDPVPLGESKLSGYQLFSKLPDPMLIDGVIMSTDPASTVSEKADYTANLVLLFTKQREVYVDYSLGKRVDPSKILDDVFSLRQMYGTLTWVPEKVGFQDILRPLAYQRMIDTGLNFSIDPATRPSSVRKNDYILGAIEPYAKSGRLFIRETLVSLIRQLNRFPKLEHDDEVDALAMGLNKIPPASMPFTRIDFSRRHPTKQEAIWKHALRGAKAQAEVDPVLGSVH